MTSIAALQCVERGLLKLDDDVSGILPEFEEIKVLTGFDGAGQPVLRRAERRVTLRCVAGFSTLYFSNLFPFFYFFPLSSCYKVLGGGKAMCCV